MIFIPRRGVHAGGVVIASDRVVPDVMVSNFMAQLPLRMNPFLEFVYKFFGAYPPNRGKRDIII
jgi:hypothetical protein